jgi:hypothetical protein
MYKTIDQYEFARWFEQSDTYKHNFTRPALFALFEYLEQYEEETGEKIEFDPIAICCEYSEYTSAIDAMREYDEIAYQIYTDGIDGEAQALEWLQERTQVITFDDNSVDGRGIIIQQF